MTSVDIYKLRHRSRNKTDADKIFRYIVFLAIRVRDPGHEITFYIHIYTCRSIHFFNINVFLKGYTIYSNHSWLFVLFLLSLVFGI